MVKRRIIKKKYIFFLVLGVLMVSMRSCLTLRTSDKEWVENFEAKGLEAPDFHNYTVGKRNIHYVHVGNDSLPLVIFIHGTPGSANAYEAYLADTTLTNRVQLISVDRPGFGYSDLGKTVYSLEEQSQLLKPILEKHPAPKVILVGHSLGGPLVARMAMDYQELIDGLILLAPSIDPELEPEEWFRKPGNWIPIRWMLPKTLRVANQEIIALKGDLEKMLPDWKNITIPVVVFQGMKDELVPMENAHFAEAQLKNSREVDLVMFPEENHFIVWTQYQIIAQRILKEATE